MKLQRIVAVLIKEVQQLGRDRMTFAMIAAMPILQLLLFGFAINTDVRNLTTGIADQSQSHLSRELVAELVQTQVIKPVLSVSTAVELEDAMRRGEIVLGVLIPADFDRRILQRRENAAQLLVDGSDPTVTAVASQLTSMPFRIDTDPRQTTGPALFQIRNFYNPERRSPVNIVPGLLGVILTMTMVLFTAVAIVKEREHGNLEFLINTPITGGELMVGKILPYIAIGLIQVTLLIALGMFLFDVPLRGSLVDLYLTSLLFIATNLALGLLISTLAKTQFQAMQATFFLMMPSILLSGFMFPFDGMPKTAQYLAELLPMTHYLRLVRGIMLRDASLFELMPSAAALGGLLLALMVLSVIRFKKRLD